MREALEHSKVTFELILKTWIITDKQRLDIQSNIDYLNEQLILPVVVNCKHENYTPYYGREGELMEKRCDDCGEDID